MIRTFSMFLRAISISSIGRLGIALVTGSFVTFVLFQIASVSGLIANAYFGLILYLGLPTLFVLGLLLIPVAFWRVRGSSGKSLQALLEDRVGPEQVEGGALGAPITRTVLVLTLVNVIFLGVAGMQGLHFMESPEFCGTACHSVMNPEWTTYQASPHARVDCVECHVGEGVDALIDSKIQGAWQMISVTFDLYERPIPTPVHTLRPAQETCEHCHWPEKFYGNKLETFVRYQQDEESTPIYSTLSIKIDSRGRGDGGVHWHVAEENEVRYASVEDQRREMIWVDARQPDGSWKRYENTDLVGDPDTAGHERRFDCVDCHNRATHVYEQPDFAIDERMRLGHIDPDLPFVKREALAAITFDYPDVEAAMAGIANHMRGYYRRFYPEVSSGNTNEIDAAIESLRSIYRRNIHPEMNITWGSYPSLLGHEESAGCFRCHNQKLKAADGSHISDDCTMCHSMLANEEPDPFLYIREPAEGQRTAAMHTYLKEEFLNSFFDQ
ncbi:MAG TPA: NapC/NirT family cytochrome c [Candidatus Krumholzibacteria bacterium]|nr:NapC/NirT family cytochrome c [Candidatus Krumholzibacteria bacterium]